MQQKETRITDNTFAAFGFNTEETTPVAKHNTIQIKGRRKKL